MPLEVARVAVRDLTKDRGLPLPANCFTDDAESVVGDPDVDIVVEVIGGIEPARSLIVDALDGGQARRHRQQGAARHARAVAVRDRRRRRRRLPVRGVGGGWIPLMRPLRESLAGDRIRRVMGIVNGTTNFILTRMSDGGQGFDDALAEAQALGFAESDPTADVEGFDAAAKAAIIASIAFGARVTAADVHREGITELTLDDIASARDLGYVVKLLAVAEELDGEVAVRVHPSMVPERHPLAAVRDSFNAVFIEGDAVGELMLYGRGAGGGPTASAVLGDLVDAAKNLVEGRKGATVGVLAAKPIRADRRGVVAVLPPDRGGRPSRRARRDRHRVRPPGRVDPLDEPARHRGGRAADLRHAQGARGRRPQDRRSPPRRRVRASRRVGAASDGRRGMIAPWRGVIEEYREFLPVSDATPVVTLLEGNTPLLDAPRVAQRAGVARVA